MMLVARSRADRSHRNPGQPDRCDPPGGKGKEVTAEEIESKIVPMAVDAMKSGNIAVNPRASRQQDIEALYRKAL